MKKSEDLFDKTREMADKAEEKLKEAFEKAKKKETYEKISGIVGKAGEYVEKKLGELKESDIPGKLGNFRDEAETQTENIIDQAKAYSSRVSDDVEKVIESLKGKKKQI